MTTFLIVLGILTLSLVVYSIVKNSKKTTKTDEVSENTVLTEDIFLPVDSVKAEEETKEEVKVLEEIVSEDAIIPAQPKEVEHVVELEQESPKVSKPAKTKSTTKKKSAKTSAKKETGAKRGRKPKKDGGDDLLLS